MYGVSHSVHLSSSFPTIAWGMFVATSIYIYASVCVPRNGFASGMRSAHDDKAFGRTYPIDLFEGVLELISNPLDRWRICGFFFSGRVE